MTPDFSPRPQAPSTPSWLLRERLALEKDPEIRASLLRALRAER